MCAILLTGELSSPLLSRYRLSERQAILVHKYFLGIELKRDPGLDCAIASWEARFALGWRCCRQQADCQEQLEEIQRYRQQLASQRGEPVDWEEAAQDWVNRYAAEWRQRHEEKMLESGGRS